MCQTVADQGHDALHLGLMREWTVGEFGPNDHDVFDIVAYTDRRHVPKATEKQAGSDDEHNAERRLKHEQRRAYARGTVGHVTTSGPKRIDEAGAQAA
jgi:hypothetical protein